MMSAAVLLVLASAVAAQLPDHLKALCLAYPTCDNYPFCDVNHVALAQGLPCANFPNCDLHHVAIAQRAKRQAATPLTPGNIPGLVPGSPAAAQWWAAQLIHRGQLAHHQKREAPAAVPLTPGNIPGLIPGSPAAAEWWTAQLIHRGQLAHHVK